MKERTRRILIMAVMAALIVSLMAASFAALTYGRYSGGRRDENSPYEDYIDFVGATAYEVRTPEQFVNAINNGYSYIKIAADAEEPFVVNNDIANVYTNLVIDVNGKTVIRNSRNPVLDVTRNISVVLVYDSSEKAKGGFYNPVGSALQTSGGTLTVGSGVYESGPSDAADATLPSSNAVSLVTRENRTSTSYNAAQSGVSLPILTKSGGDKTKSGDKYLPENWTDTVSGDQINPDTYLLYAEVQNAFVGSGQTADGTIPDASAPADPDNPVVFQSGQLYINCEKFTVEGENNTKTTTYSADIFSPVSNVASCDFYYYYPIDNDAYSSTAGSPAAPKTYAVVYGYNDVNSLAKTENTGLTEYQGGTQLVWPYAAIRSVRDGTVGGNTHARGGEFYTYFGEENTYSIYSEGGTMTVGGTAEPTFSAVQSGVCIKMVGQGTEDSLTINSGEFSSEIGNTIQMEGGEMEVKNGKFTKTGCKQGTDAQRQNQTAIISLLGGKLNVSGTKTGDDTYSVTMTAGAENSTLENVFGIRADGGTVTTKGVSFHIYGDYSAGVLSYDGEIDLGNDTVINVQQSDAKTHANNILLTSAGVSSEQASEGEEHPVNLSGGVTITSNGLGITARGVVNVTGGESTVTTERGTGIYVNNGQFNVEEDAIINVNSTVKSGFAWTTPPESETTNTPNIYNGVYVQGGSLKSEGELNVTFTGVENESHKSYDALKIRSYAVRVEAAATGDDTEVKITAGTIINQVQYDEQGKEIAGGGGGVYVGGGKVTLGVRGKGGPTIGTTGVSFGVENTSVGGGNWKYYENKTGGHAVEVNGGDLFVYGGLYTAALGNGILVCGGNAWVLDGIFQGNDTDAYRENYGDGNLPAGPAAYYALKLLGGSVTTFGGTFGTYTVDDNTTHTAGGSSAFVTGVSSQATANIYGGSFVVNGQAGFSVYQNVALTFKPKETVPVGEGQNLTGSDVKVSAVTTAIAIENTDNTNVSVTINGGTFESLGTTDKRDGIWYSNPYAKLTINQLEGQITTISANAQHGIRLVHAPDTKDGVKITGGTITGAQHGILYVDTTDNGKVAHVDDGLLIEGGTIEGKSGAGLYFAANPWQKPDNVATNNVAIVGGTFIGVSVYHYAVLDRNKYWTNGAIGAPSNSQDNGLGHDIQITDIIVCDPNLNPGKSIYYSESPRGENDYSQTLQYYYDNNLQLGEDFRDDQKINQTTCRYNRVEIR